MRQRLVGQLSAFLLKDSPQSTTRTAKTAEMEVIVTRQAAELFGGQSFVSTGLSNSSYAAGSGFELPVPFLERPLNLPYIDSVFSVTSSSMVAPRGSGKDSITEQSDTLELSMYEGWVNPRGEPVELPVRITSSLPQDLIRITINHNAPAAGVELRCVWWDKTAQVKRSTRS